ncbi:MAG: amidohydrolase family protein [Nitrospiraceae bacterium]|nr:amidohydrolase family protein [Nitrospiraceae bacterium]
MKDMETINNGSHCVEEAALTQKKVIDIHAHIVGPGDSGSGCSMSREFRFGPAFAAMLMGLRIGPLDATDGKIRAAVLASVEASSSIDHAVVLALDGVYKNGSLAAAESQVIVANDYVMGLAAESGKVLLGASVHPYREPRNMQAEMRRCLDAGAALFVWAPACQQINPEDDRCIPFYLCLAREGIPLLCHGGTVFTTRSSAAKFSWYNESRRLRRALDIGVKVIISYSHASCGGVFPSYDYDSIDDLLEMLRSADENGWELYADISALCSPSGTSCLERLKREIAMRKVRPERILFGSDFPRPVIDISSLRRGMTPDELRQRLMCGGNMFDSAFDALRKFGMDEAVFTSAADILRL